MDNSPLGGSVRGYTLVLIGVTCFSLNAAVSRLILDTGVSAWTLSQFRALGATVLLAVILLVARRSFRLPAHHRTRIVVYGILGLALVQALYFEAIARIPIGLALLIEFLGPVWVALWARFVQRQFVSNLLWPALALTVIGLALVAGAGLSGLDPWGVAAAFGAGLSFAVYFVVGEELVADTNPFVVSFWGFAIAAVVWLLATPLIPTLIPVWEVDYSSPITLPMSGLIVPAILLFAWLVSLGTVVPFAAETSAMRWVPATTVSVLATAEPIAAGAVAWWLFGETAAAVQLVGALLVIAGIVLALLSRSGHRLPAVVD